MVLVAKKARVSNHHLTLAMGHCPTELSSAVLTPKSLPQTKSPKNVGGSPLKAIAKLRRKNKMSPKKGDILSTATC